MRTIHKYQIPLQKQTIEMPENAIYLHCGYDPQGILSIWALVDTESKMQEHTFIKIGTGWSLDGLEEQCNMRYLTTVNDNDGYVWHICELSPKRKKMQCIKAMRNAVSGIATAYYAN